MFVGWTGLQIALFIVAAVLVIVGVLAAVLGGQSVLWTILGVIGIVGMSIVEPWAKGYFTAASDKEEPHLTRTHISEIQKTSKQKTQTITDARGNRYFVVPAH